MRTIIPAVLERNPSELRKKVKIAESLSNRIQIDVADGKFVKNKTVGISELKRIKSKSKIEFHLMVQKPAKYIETLSKNADIIAVHCEIPNFEGFMKGKVKAVAINPTTTVKKLLPVIKQIKKVIVLTVAPGWQGRKFYPPALKKIKQIRKMNKKIIIQVDGGINEKTIRLAEKAGADEFVVGSAIVKSKNPRKMYELLRQ
jgi:ribulose-phosphate 3-epimerase